MIADLLNTCGSFENASKYETSSCWEHFQSTFSYYFVFSASLNSFCKVGTNIIVKCLCELALERGRCEAQFTIQSEGVQLGCFGFLGNLLSFSLNDILGIVEIFVFVNSCEERPSVQGSLLEILNFEVIVDCQCHIVFRYFALENDIWAKSGLVDLLDLSRSVSTDILEVLFSTNLTAERDEGVVEVCCLSQPSEEVVRFCFRFVIYGKILIVVYRGSFDVFHFISVVLVCWYISYHVKAAGLRCSWWSACTISACCSSRRSSGRRCSCGVVMRGRKCGGQGEKPQQNKWNGSFHVSQRYFKLYENQAYSTKFDTVIHYRECFYQDIG